MRSIETPSSVRTQIIPYFDKRLCWYALCHSTSLPSVSELVEVLLSKRLAHRLAQSCDVLPGQSADVPANLHNLLLVHRDPERLFEIGLEQGVRINHRLLAIVAGGPGPCSAGCQRTRAGQGGDGNYVLDVSDLYLAGKRLQGIPIELKYPGPIAVVQNIERLLVVQRQALQKQPRQAGQLQGVLEY